jgi:hypothetical protein
VHLRNAQILDFKAVLFYRRWKRNEMVCVKI